MHLKEEQIMNCGLNDSKVEWHLWIAGRLSAREARKWEEIGQYKLFGWIVLRKGHL